MDAMTELCEQVKRQFERMMDAYLIAKALRKRARKPRWADAMAEVLK